MVMLMCRELPSLPENFVGPATLAAVMAGLNLAMGPTSGLGRACRRAYRVGVSRSGGRNRLGCSDGRRERLLNTLTGKRVPALGGVADGEPIVSAAGNEVAAARG